MDPFGTNGMIDAPVASVWKRVYPNIVIDDTEMDVVVTVVRLFILGSNFMY